MPSINSVLSQWSSKSDFFKAQSKMAVILLISFYGNNWEPSYPRNENHNMPMFWLMNLLLLIGAIATWKHTPKPASRGVTFLNRGQTEEWKGWMQWAFIMYHYYRAWSAYNWIRVFVSSYVWMVSGRGMQIIVLHCSLYLQGIELSLTNYFFWTQYFKDWLRQLSVFWQD